MDGYRPGCAALLALLLLCLMPLVVSAESASFRLERLDQEVAVPPELIIGGGYDADFRPTGGDEIRVTKPTATWWRVVLLATPNAAETPQLVFTQPYRKQVELWRAFDSPPVRRATFGKQADYRHSTRFLVFPLDTDARAGDVLYLRILSPNLTASKVSIMPLEQVHSADVWYARYRTAVLVSLMLIALFAFGHFAALREPGYAFLGLTLVAQLISVAIEGGEIRFLQYLAEFAQDRRTNIVISTVAVLTGIRFLVFFLDLHRRQSRLAAILDLCSVVLGGLLLVSVVRVWPASAYLGNTVMLVAFAVIAIALIRAVIRLQREAFVLLLAWTPLMGILVVIVGGLQQWWPLPEWAMSALPSGLALSGVCLMAGLTSKVQQLRQDRDLAQRRWTFDKLTGVITRDAILEILHAKVESAHKSATPLSVAFIDIDFFKAINDRYGHAAGDEAIRVVALRIRNWLPSEHLVARFGGDEMLLLFIGASLADAAEDADALRAAVTANPLSIDGQLIPVTLSVGVAELAEGEAASALLARADAALYRSKSGGRSMVSVEGGASEFPGVV